MQQVQKQFEISQKNKQLSKIDKHRNQASIKTLKYSMGNSNEANKTRLQTNMHFYNLTEKSAKQLYPINFAGQLSCPNKL